MKELFEKRLENLIREYEIWKRQLKKDIETYDDDTAKEQKGSYDALVIVIQDLKKLKNIEKRK